MNLCTICQLLWEGYKWEAENPECSWTQGDSAVMLYDSREDDTDKIMHDSWEMFLVSLGQNCPICWSMWRKIRSSPLADAREETRHDFRTIVLSVNYNLEDSSYRAQLRIMERGESLGLPIFNIWKTTGQCFLEDSNTIRKLHTPETVAQLAKGWVADCLNTHSACHQRSIASTSLPTRLLDIGNSFSKQWAIVKTEGDTQEYDRYVALTHRWADTMPKLLHKGGFRIESTYQDGELPRHFQDVISICRAMTIQYLWIDSLCIFQDSDEDFQQEAAIMADIYENAFLTLSICWDYSSASLFQEVKPQTIPRTQPASFLASTKGKDMKASTTIADHAFVEFTEGFSVDVVKSLINRRGWVVQERFLSPRIVYLGNEQIYWECDVHIASEVVPQNLRGWGKRTELDAGIGHLSWPSVMKAYSKCSLTRQEDKLIAISGLARSLCKRSGHTYFSGIWIEYWIQDLMWIPNTLTVMTVDGITQWNELTDTLEAPSWLWLGCSKDIIPSSIPRGQEFTSSNLCSFKGQTAFAMSLLVNWRLEQLRSNEKAFVSFAGASLEIMCLAIPIGFDKTEMMEEISCRKFGANLYWQEDIKWKGEKISCLLLRFMNSFDAEKDISPEAYKLHLEFSQRYEPSLPCFLIPLCAGTGHEGEAPDCYQEPSMGGLVVQQTSNGQFRRIACFWQARSCYFGIPSLVLNTVSKQEVGAHGTSETDGEQAYKAAFLEYATTQTSLPMFDHSTDDAKLSWSQVSQIKNLSWRKIELV